MKKTVLTVLVLSLLLALCACGNTAPAAPAASAEPTPEMTSTLPGSELSEAAPEESAEAPALDEAAYEAAKGCIDKSVDELYKAIGEPSDSSYAPSCLNVGAGGEDGELYYEGFTVVTYREGDKETVRDVMLNVD